MEGKQSEEACRRSGGVEQNICTRSHSIYTQFLFSLNVSVCARHLISNKPCTVDFRLIVQKLRREFTHAQNFLFKIPAQVRACADSRRNFGQPTV